MEADLRKHHSRFIIIIASTVILVIAAGILATFLLTKPATLSEVAQGQTLHKAIERMPAEKELIRGVAKEEERVENLLHWKYDSCVKGVNTVKGKLGWWERTFRELGFITEEKIMHSEL